MTTSDGLWTLKTSKQAWRVKWGPEHSATMEVTGAENYLRKWEAGLWGLSFKQS